MGGKQLGRDAAARGTTKGSGAGGRPATDPRQSSKRQCPALTAALIHMRCRHYYRTAAYTVWDQYGSGPQAGAWLGVSASPPCQQHFALAPRSGDSANFLGTCFIIWNAQTANMPSLHTTHCNCSDADAPLCPPLPPIQHTASVAARRVRAEPGCFGSPYTAGVRSKVRAAEYNVRQRAKGGTARNEIRAKPGTGSLSKVFMGGR